MTRVKGLDTMIDAVSLLLRSGMSGFDVILVGDGAERHPVQARARSAGLNGVVQFLGLRTASEVRDLLRGSDCLLMPSRHESFGLAAAEALSTGIPVIAADVGALPWVLAGTGSVLVPPQDAAA